MRRVSNLTTAPRESSAQPKANGSAIAPNRDDQMAATDKSSATWKEEYAFRVIFSLALAGAFCELADSGHLVIRWKQIVALLSQWLG